MQQGARFNSSGISVWGGKGSCQSTILGVLSAGPNPAEGKGCSDPLYFLCVMLMVLMQNRNKLLIAFQ